MFRVENADFIADKLASELLPDQEYREVLKNAEEAVTRRLAAEGVVSGGRIEFDVDWSLLAATGNWFLACADNGDGMSRSELEKYTTTLAVRGAGNSQGIAQNQGMGLKISGPTRHKRGVLIRSLKNGEGWQVQVGHDGQEYGLIPVGPAGELIARVPLDVFPPFVREQGSGTLVTFLGNEDHDNTFLPPKRIKNWLFKYANQRFFRLSDGAISVFVRVPSGDVTQWPRTAQEASDRQNNVAEGPSFNLSRVKGTGTVWDEASKKLGSEFRGIVELDGVPNSGIPAARMHWWVHPTEGSDVSTRTYSPGSIAAMFQNELHDWRIGGQANPFFGRMGILFGKNRVSFVVEPVGPNITSDFARAHVLVSGTPVFESDAWLVWSDQFREAMPEPVKAAMAEEQARVQDEDPDRVKRIRDRLKEVMQQLRPRRFKAQADGDVQAMGPEVIGTGNEPGEVVERVPGPGKPRPKPTATRGIGSVLSQLGDEDAVPSSEVFPTQPLTPRWITEAEAEGYTIVNANGRGLHDRAAALVGETAGTANTLLLNLEFRGYQAILAAVNDWANPDGDEARAAIIESSAQEWVEQKMIEAVTGLRQLENGSTWLTSNFDDALSPVALTAAFMADRYHTLREVKRQVGSIRKPAESKAS